MRKFAVVVAVVLGVALVPAGAGAAPIGTSSCLINGDGAQECDIYADFEVDGSSDLTPTLGEYLLGYTVLLNASADLSDGFDVGDVAHILVIHSQLFELFSNTAVNLAFSDIFTAATTGADIDTVPISSGQLAGCPPNPAGVPNIDGVGYCTTADLITVFPVWGAGGEGGIDILRIHTALADTQPPTPNPVPEPGTMSLLALGGAAAAAVRRRRAAKEAKAQASSN